MAGPEKLLGARRNSGRRDSGQAAVSGPLKAPHDNFLGLQNISETVKIHSNRSKSDKL